MNVNWFSRMGMRLKGEFSDAEKVTFWLLFVVILCLTVIYRWYQPITQQALLQFDVFDWARQSKEWLAHGHLVTPTTLWVFPVWNALVSRVTGLDLFYVYLFSGAFLTTFNLFLIYGISTKLWRKPMLRLIPLLLYALNTQLLSRSVNYLPETLSYTFGLLLVFFYLKLFFDRKLAWLVPIGVVNYLYYHLHQSGINFLIFTVVVVIFYVLFVLQQSWTRKVVIMALLGVIGAGCIATNAGIQQQMAFFLNGSKNADTAFQGTPIPFNQFATDYPYVFYSLFVLGTASIVYQIIRGKFKQRNVAWYVIFIITAFYFSFLYILPNLKLYSLVPWRFYTWFTLYAIFIVAEGFSLVTQVFQKHRLINVALIISFLLYNLSHATLISDNMYTADAATLQSMARTTIPRNSVVVTTNANYLQAKYAFLDKAEVTTVQGGDEIFRSAGSTQLNSYIATTYPNREVYILVSLYQLKQRPSNIAYWKNSAIYDMDLNIFSDPEYFSVAFHDDNVVLYRKLGSVNRVKYGK